MTVITLRDVVPPPRGDGNPWTKARFQESTDSAGTFTTIETITFSPVDADPVHPQERIVTTENATLANGWYRLIFEDANGDLSAPTGPVQNVQQETPAYMPSVADVGSILRARTKDANGNELGTFTAETRPNTQQAISAIRSAVGDVFAVVGDGIIPRLYGDAAGVATIGAAMLIELSYFPEQVASGRSPYDKLKELYDLRLQSLRLAVENATNGDTVNAGNVPAAMWDFGDSVVIGRKTIW